MKRLMLVLLGGLSLLAGIPAHTAASAPVAAGAGPASTVGALPTGVSVLPASVSVVPAGAGAVPADPRITAAVKAWRTSPLYVDPLFTGALGRQEADLRRQIAAMPMAVYVAVLPHGDWFAEKGDTVRLAGWLATANGKPGVYVVVDRTTATGAAHLVRAYAPARAYEAKEYTPVAQLDAYLKSVELRDRLDADPARTDPLAERPTRVSEPEKFTVGKALANGLGGCIIGGIGGALLSGLLVALAAAFGRLREGHG